MRFIDSINITVIAGNGGNGYVGSQKRRKGNFLENTNGSNGGDGGDVWLVSDITINTLNFFYSNRIFKAGDGECGRSRGCTGKKGRDITIKVPYGTRVLSKKTRELLGDMSNDRCNRLRVAKGGRRGLGDRRFLKFCKYHGNNLWYKIYGQQGESHNLLLELLLIADVGMFGLPNSGKSSFVRAISAATPKVADYPFTTIVPSLGVVNINNHENFIIVDIPSIIVGSATGSGLGIRFLKHLEHCQILLHFVDLVSIDNEVDPVINILSIERELKNYNEVLVNKPCWLVFNKIDLLKQHESEKKVNNIIKSLKWSSRYYLVSTMYGTNILPLCNDIMQFMKYINRKL